MKILHAPIDIGGMPFTFAQAQRELGFNAVSYVIDASPTYRFKADIQASRSTFRKRLSVKWNAIRFALQFDVFHFYFGESLTSHRLREIGLLKKLGKKVFFYFCGCDIRDSKKMISTYQYSACRFCWPMLCSPNRDLACRVARDQADAVFVSTADLLEFVPGSIWLPQPVNLKLFDGIASNVQKHKKDEEEIVLVHAPTSRTIKGSDYLIRAVDDLKAKGYKIRLCLLEKMPYRKVLEEYVKADIIVDQLLAGWYGQVSIEAMALGKPAICYIREDLNKHSEDGLPVVSANIDSIRDVLEDLLNNRDRLGELGQRGRAYVEKHHDARKVAEKAVEVYKNA
jgi:glycosyltransferase involved in cell wall biosynthesis